MKGERERERKRERERDVRVHFALVTDASLVRPLLLTYVSKESNDAINHSHRSDERKSERPTAPARGP